MLWRSFCALALTVSFGLAATEMATPAKADGPAPKRKTAQFEINFLKSMIDHHFMAVMMAETCQEQAIHPELFQLCEQIETTQSEEIAMMQGWLLEWYGIDYEPQMTEEMEQQVAHLASLSGAEYEIAFLHHMIEHHEGAVEESADCIKRAYHEELVELCIAIGATQSEEIELMQDWLCDWYEMCYHDDHQGGKHKKQKTHGHHD